MRKANQKIKDKSILEDIVKQSRICRIGMVDNEVPYVLPFNYGYKNNHLYIHCATSGRKIDILKKNPKVCFEIEDKTDIVKDDIACMWTTTYRSVVGYGEIEIITDFAQKRKGLEIIMAHHGAPDLVDFESSKIDSVLILKPKIDTWTGKQSSNWDKVHSL